MKSIYDFKVKDTEGNEVSLEKYRGKVLLIVNTATGCAFTPQYTGLEKLYKKYKEEGFEVLDFPCNQFAHQAPGSNEEIVTFCRVNYDTKFTTFAKLEVNGDKASPLFVFLKSKAKGIGGRAIKWNFTKFLVDKKGQVIGRFSPATAPEKLEGKIKELLKKK